MNVPIQHYQDFVQRLDHQVSKNQIVDFKLFMDVVPLSVASQDIIRLKKTILLYGTTLAALIFLLKVLEYRFFAHDLSLEFYVSLVALFFTALGAWVGLRLTRNRKTIVAVQAGNFKVSEDILKQTGISKREHEVLELMAQGNSNQEIADKLFVSLNTVKTHSSNLFVKLDVKRRTQAIQRAKELRLLP